MIILGGSAIVHIINHEVHTEPHWTGKVCTFLLMVTLGWVMLKIIPLSPLYPISITSVFVVLSGIFYVRSGVRQVHEHDHAKSR